MPVFCIILGDMIIILVVLQDNIIIISVSEGKEIINEPKHYTAATATLVSITVRPLPADVLDFVFIQIKYGINYSTLIVTILPTFQSKLKKKLQCFE